MSTARMLAPALAVVAVVAAACSPPAPVVPSPTPSHIVTSPTPSPTPLTPAEQDLRSAEQAVVALVAKVDALAQDPTSDLTSLAEVARDQAFTDELAVILDHAQKNWIQRGETLVVSALAVKGSGQWRVRACLDLSRVDVVDASGNSVVSPDRPDRYEYEFGVTADATRFYVVSLQMVDAC